VSKRFESQRLTLPLLVDGELTRAADAVLGTASGFRTGLLEGGFAWAARFTMAGFVVFDRLARVVPARGSSVALGDVGGWSFASADSTGAAAGSEGGAMWINPTATSSEPCPSTSPVVSAAHASPPTSPRATRTLMVNRRSEGMDKKPSGTGMTPVLPRPVHTNPQSLV